MQRLELIHNRVMSRSVAGYKGCVVWTGPRNKNEHGVVRYYPETHKSMVYTHRVVYAYSQGLNSIEDVDGMVLHTCDTYGCNNKYHLYLGTAKDNKNDRDTRTGNKLSYEKAELIRDLYNVEGFSIDELAQWYCVTRGTISHIINNRTWVQ